MAPWTQSLLVSEIVIRLPQSEIRPTYSLYMLVKNADPRFLALLKALKPLFLIPFDRDTSFINRIEIFNDIRNHSKQHHRLALSGIGGIGSVIFTVCSRRLQSIAEISLENHRLRLSTATVSAMTILMRTFFGFMPVQSNGLNRHTET